MQPRRYLARFEGWVTCALALLAVLGDGLSVHADDAPAGRPIAKFITLKSPVEGAVAGHVRNTALVLQDRAARENRPAYMILEITPGTTEFPHVISLANFLASGKTPKVRTIAWVPQTVTGNNAVLALACHEIVMHPDAELGDVGRGRALDETDSLLVRKLIANRNNPKVSAGLAEGMIDPAARVLRAEVTEGETTTVHVVTEAEIVELQKTVTERIETRPLSEQGDPLLLSGQKARDLDVLAVATAGDRTDLLKRYDLPFDALVEEVQDDAKPRVALIRVTDRIDPVMKAFIGRQIQRSVGRGVNTIVFEIDAPGGVLTDSADLARTIADLGDRKQPVRTVAYVPQGNFDGAFGGAAIVALGCDEIYLQPDALFGDVAGAEFHADNADEVEAMQQPIGEILDDLADRKRRPRAILRAMLVPNSEVYRVRHVDTDEISFLSKSEIDLGDHPDWVKDGVNPVVPETIGESTLRIDGQRAAELQIAEPPVADRDDLQLRLGVPGQKLAVAQRNWVDDVVFLLNTDAALYILLVAGFVLMFLEAHLTTGFMAFGSILCFVLFFWSRYLGGTAGTLEVILCVAGLVCLAIEAFVMPGFGVFGLLGGLFFFTSIVMASQTFGNLEPNEDFTRMATTLGTMGLAVISVMIIGMVASRYLPHVPLFRHMILHPPGGEEEESPRLKRELAESFAGIFTGDEGVTATTLRPAGKATIKGKYLDVVSDGPYIQPGETVEVVSIAGNRVVVRVKET
jgi:membrane-bound serine protease (ClpP class)